MDTALEFRLLGPFEVIRDGKPVALGGARRRAVLAMLALECGRVVSVSRLVEGVWGEDPPETAVTALHGHVSQLRRAVGAVVATRAPGYLLAAEPESVDLARFELLLERGRQALAAADPEAARALFDDALGLWRGPPLGDLANAPFAAAALPAVEELVLAAREERVEAGLQLGLTDDVIPTLKTLVAQQPLRERSRGQLMLALYRAGRQAEALAVYDAGRRLFAEDLGIEPGEPLRHLHESILREDAGIAPRTRRTRIAAASPRRRRRGRIVAAVAGLSVMAAVAVIAASGGAGDDSAARSPELRGGGLIRIDPDALRIATVTSLGGTPQSVAAGPGRAWVIDADYQTVTEVGSDGRRVRTFATGATPIDLGTDGKAVWIVEGRAGPTQFQGARATGLTRLTRTAGDSSPRVALPASGPGVSEVQSDRVAVTDDAVWAIAGDGALAQVDPATGDVERTLPLRAVAVAAEGARAWALTTDGTLVPVDERRASSGAPIDVSTTEGSLAVGGGAVWVGSPDTGLLSRIDPVAPRDRRTARIGAGLGAVAFGLGAVWVADRAGGRVLRIDPESGSVTGEVDVHGVPRDIAVSSDGVWVSVAAPTAGAPAGCGDVVQGREPADRIIVAELPLRRGARSPTSAMARAIAYTVRSAGFRAGRWRLGYRICDDSLAQSGSWDPDKCIANARGYARDRRIVLEVGPYNSGCAQRQLAITAAAPGGPLAMVSPTNTDPLLTRDVRPSTTRGYARIIARDDRQAAAMAAHLRKLGHRSVFVLDDGAFGLAPGSYFAAAARAEALRIAGRASWPTHAPAAIARRVAGSGADAVYVSGLLDDGAGAIVRALRRALPADVTVAGNEGLLPIADLFTAAGPAARNVLITTGSVPIAALPPAGRELAATLARHQGDDEAHPFAVLAAQATQIGLDAIARSDGTRRSVAQALLATDLPRAPLGRISFDVHGDLRHPRVAILRARRAGGSRQLGSPDGAQLMAVR